MAILAASFVELLSRAGREWNSFRTQSYCVITDFVRGLGSRLARPVVANLSAVGTTSQNKLGEEQSLRLAAPFFICYSSDSGGLVVNIEYYCNNSLQRHKLPM